MRAREREREQKNKKRWEREKYSWSGEGKTGKQKDSGKIYMIGNWLAGFYTNLGVFSVQQLTVWQATQELVFRFWRGHFVQKSTSM